MNLVQHSIESKFIQQKNIRSVLNLTILLTETQIGASKTPKRSENWNTQQMKSTIRNGGVIIDHGPKTQFGKGLREVDLTAGPTTGIAAALEN